MAVRDTLTLHPVTISRAESIAAELRRAKRKKPVRGPAVETYRVPPEVLAVAVKLAGGDKRRIELCRDGTAVVHNKNRKGKSWNSSSL